MMMFENTLLKSLKPTTLFSILSHLFLILLSISFQKNKTFILNLLFYLCIINGLTAILFIVDKWISSRNGKRISESTLHFFEFSGGIFAVILLMPTIRHKNRKKSYWITSIFIAIGWVVFLIYYMVGKFC